MRVFAHSESRRDVLLGAVALPLLAATPLSVPAANAAEKVCQHG